MFVPHMMAAIAMIDFIFLQMAILILFMSTYFQETLSSRPREGKHIHAEHDQEGTASKSCVPNNLTRERFHNLIIRLCS